MFLAEAGILEYQALLLAESIRNFTGKYSDSKITVISPRIDKRPLSTTINRLKDLDVEYLPLNLKSICPEYGTSYRILASAYFEKKSKADTLVVLDSDTIFMKEPDLELFDYDIGIRPVDVKGMCTTGNTDDPMDKYWRQLCQCCEVDYDAIPMTISTVDRQIIKSSYNGGLIVAKKSANIFSETNQYFIKSINAGLLPYKGTSNQVRAGHGMVTPNGSQYWGSSQACLSLAVTKLKLKIKVFSPSSNFPLHIFEHFNSLTKDSIKEINHIHYHHLIPTLFNQEFINDKFLLFPSNFRDWLSKRHAQLFDEIQLIVGI